MDFDLEFGSLFKRNLSLWSSLYTFRTIGNLGLPNAMSVRLEEHKKHIKELLTSDEYKGFMLDPARFVSDGHAARAPMEMATRDKQSFQSSLDSASIIFAHSIFDAIVFDYLRLATLRAPGDWLYLVQDRKLSLSQFENCSFEEALIHSLDKFVWSEIERESLLKKLDLLISVLKPPKGVEILADFKYDRNRIVAFDSLRHDIVHKPDPSRKFSDVDGTNFYMQRCTIYIMSLLNKKYDLRLGGLF